MEIAVIALSLGFAISLIANLIQGAYLAGELWKSKYDLQLKRMQMEERLLNEHRRDLE